MGPGLCGVISRTNRLTWHLSDSLEKSAKIFDVEQRGVPLRHGDLHSGAQRGREERRDGGGTLPACAVQPLPSGVPEAWLGVTGHPTSLSRHSWADASLRGITGAPCSQKNCKVWTPQHQKSCHRARAYWSATAPGGTAGSPRPGPVPCRPVNYKHMYAEGRGERETAGQGRGPGGI